jgi:hypothetical protein
MVVARSCWEGAVLVALKLMIVLALLVARSAL